MLGREIRFEAREVQNDPALGGDGTSVVSAPHQLNLDLFVARSFLTSLPANAFPLTLLPHAVQTMRNARNVGDTIHDIEPLR